MNMAEGIRELELGTGLMPDLNVKTAEGGEEPEFPGAGAEGGVHRAARGDGVTGGVIVGVD